MYTLLMQSTTASRREMHLVLPEDREYLTRFSEVLLSLWKKPGPTCLSHKVCVRTGTWTCMYRATGKHPKEWTSLFLYVFIFFRPTEYQAFFLGSPEDSERKTDKSFWTDVITCFLNHFILLNLQNHSLSLWIHKIAFKNPQLFPEVISSSVVKACPKSKALS